MPLKIACPAGHKLVIAGSTAEGPLVCPRCGLPVGPDAAGTEIVTPVVATEASENVLVANESSGADDVDLPVASCANSVTPLPPAAPTSAAPRLPVIQVRPKVSGKSTWKPGAGLFGGTLVAAAIAMATPAIGEFVAALGDQATAVGTAPARWAILLAWLALIQAAYGAYCWLWADWSSLRMVKLVLVLQAGMYAGLLAIILLANPHGWILGERGLQLTDALEGGRAALVCLSLICLCAILALFAARQSMQWRSIGARQQSSRSQADYGSVGWL
jgi:hypothetical protein